MRQPTARYYLVAFSASVMLCGWVGTSRADRIPAPPHSTAKGAEEQVTFGDNAVGVHVYETTDRPSDVLEFYREEMPERRWEVVNTPPIEQVTAIAEASDMGAGHMAKLSQQGLMYHRGQEFVQISVQPQAANLTMVIINRWKRSPMLAMDGKSAEDSFAEQRQEERQMADSAFMPRYEDAERVMATGDFHAGMAIRAYRTPAPYEQVVAFYEETMPRLGWHQTKARTAEHPMQYPALGIDAVATERVITYKGNGGVCILNIGFMPMPEAAVDPQTTIMMTYRKLNNQELLKRYGSQ